ncbi:MAG: hypothetical protein JXB05_03105 [Myxococcaceae bacterium]|nr:hypothetical protein [Myxococcaceae bacterium]
MSPKIDSPRSHVSRAPERKEAPAAASSAPQQKTLGPTRQKPADGFERLAPTKGGSTHTGIVPPSTQRGVPASLSIDPKRLESFQKVSTNMVNFALESGVKSGREIKKSFEAGFVLAGATLKEAKFLARRAHAEYRACASRYDPDSIGGLTVEKGYRSLSMSTSTSIEGSVGKALPSIKSGMKLNEIQALALDTAKNAPDLQPDQLEVARDYFLFTAGKALSAEGFDFGTIATPSSPLDTTRIDRGDWRQKLQFLP